jgi:hypothetical protein
MTDVMYNIVVLNRAASARHGYLREQQVLYDSERTWIKDAEDLLSFALPVLVAKLVVRLWGCCSGVRQQPE